MKQQVECKQQGNAEYQKPDLEFVEFEPVWCDGSYDPIKGDDETPFIFL